MTVQKEREGKRRKRRGWMASQARMEEILAKAVIIDGREEWYCWYCSETNMWTRSKCRRCQTIIPIEKPKLDNARRLQGIYFIGPEDMEFKESIKKARKIGNTNGSSYALQDLKEKQVWRDP